MGTQPKKHLQAGKLPYVRTWREDSLLREVLPVPPRLLVSTYEAPNTKSVPYKSNSRSLPQPLKQVPFYGWANRHREVW